MNTPVLSSLSRLLLSLLLASAMSPAQAASDPAPVQAAPAPVRMPIIVGPATETVTDLLDCQCGAVAAALLPDGRVFLNVLNHDVGGIQYWIDDGDNTLVDVAEPAHIVASYDTSPAPALDFPALKTGPGGVVVKGDMVINYAGARQVDSDGDVIDGGRYHLVRHTKPIKDLP